MILYEIKENEKVIAYFKSKERAVEYCKLIEGLEMDEIQIMYDAIDVFRGDEIMDEDWCL